MKMLSSKIHAIVVFLIVGAACALVIFSQTPTQPASQSVFELSASAFNWSLNAVGFISLAAAVVYGFVKKQKYANLETERDELKSLAESREARIKELKHNQEESDARWQASAVQKDAVITDLRESNSALVSTSLQMKGILRRMRLDGKWEGHEEEIHDTYG